MTPPFDPQFPIYIPSKSRAQIATTPGALDRMQVPYRIVIEEHQHDEYAARFVPPKLLILDPQYIRDYDSCIPDFPEGKSKGSGPARNFIWEHSISEGYDRHWIMDDNIQGFWRLHQNQRIPVGDGLCFVAMEEFVQRYRNIALAGPQYFMFATSRHAWPPFMLNTRVFSCILIRNDIGLRWRARYNEDLDLSIRALQAGWCTLQFWQFLQWKTTTQLMPGGNTEAFYAEEGTRAKSEMIVRLHPDICRPARRYGRDHHHADFSRWRNRELIPYPDRPPVDLSKYPLRMLDRETAGQEQ